MNRIPILRNSAVSAALVSIMLLPVPNAAHAQAGAATQNSTGTQSTPAQANAAQTSSAAGQPAAGWSETAPDRGNWFSRIFGSSASGPARSDQAGSGGTWSSARQGYSTCRDAASGQEDFLCKLGRILWGPDTPRGPNRDMDDNVAAGGAGG
ncbi:hypothetical protein [Nitrosovibrio tenuis]|uniref:Uncharacterized protein n=1 Tax=Nitrosovibrio tenuis TaxID=1233 RepID=A0A1H7N0W1_9PROT|nr:hypothetical protein [Nitrosovibrio tenuis]SEL17226.1 hypothetical protein SAMN05216387_10619 [Nitrosovibrio tenuis]